MADECRLCLNLNMVRREMAERKMSKKDLCNQIGIKDQHTLNYYFNNPDRIKLNTITAIAKALGAKSYTFDDYVVRITSDEEYERLVSIMKKKKR